MLDIIRNSAGGILTIAQICGFLLALMLSFGCHEWAHAFVATKQGDETAKALGRLSLNPLVHLDPIGTICLLVFGFGWAKPVPVNQLKFRNYRKGMFLVSIAGIVMNLIMSVVFSLIYVIWLKYVISTSALSTFIKFLLQYLTVIPFILAIFNLLPIYPLDGFRALRAYSRYDNKFFKFMEQYGTYIMLIFLLSSLFSIILTFAINYILQPLIDLWLLIL